MRLEGNTTKNGKPRV